MIKPAIGYAAICRCGKRGFFAATKGKARRIAIDNGWWDLHPSRSDDKTTLLCKPCGDNFTSEEKDE